MYTVCIYVPRKVVEHGLYMKHCKVEVYLMDFKLSLHPNYETISTKSFSRGDTVGVCYIEYLQEDTGYVWGD